jgi:hypothetical protein
MRRVIAFAALLCACAGCGTSAFYTEKSDRWFSVNSEQPEASPTPPAQRPAANGVAAAPGGRAP